jgi:hypothetical protein
VPQLEQLLYCECDECPVEPHNEDGRPDDDAKDGVSGRTKRAKTGIGRGDKRREEERESERERERMEDKADQVRILRSGGVVQ